MKATESSEDSLLAGMDSSEIFSVAVESEIFEMSAIPELLAVSTTEESEDSTAAEEALAEEEVDESLDDPHAVSAVAEHKGYDFLFHRHSPFLCFYRI